MDIDEKIAQELFESDHLDLPAIRRYVAWVKFRRMIHHSFYLSPHWITSLPKPKQFAHWVGRQP